MSNDFNWQTDEEVDWSSTPIESSKPQPHPKSRRRWLPIIVAALLLGIVAVILYTQIQRRLAAAESLVTEELLTSVNLAQEASQDGDGDLFNALLSGRDQQWADDVQSLATNQRLYGRPDFGLSLIDSSAEPTVTLSPDFAAAEVTLPLAYQTSAGQTVTLVQTAVYRRGELRWLLSPPAESFWGQIQTSGGTHLTLIYPERDAELASRLLIAFDETLTQVCETEALIQCPLGFIVRLTTAPASLRGEPWLTPGNQLLLPTPSLFGVPSSPQDEAQFIQSYVMRLLTAVFADSTAYECCQQRAIFQALLDAQLVQLGFLPQQFSDTDLQTFITETDLLDMRSQLETAWSTEFVDPNQKRFLQALAEVAQMAAPNTGLPNKMAQLAENQTPQVWLQQVSPSFEAQWQAIRREAGQFPALAVQDVRLLCSQALIHYHTDTRRIEPLLLGINNGRQPLLPLPNGVLLQGTLAHTGLNQWQVAAFTSSEAEIIFSHDLEPNDNRSFSGTTDPSGRTLVIQISPAAVANNSVINQFGALDIESCRDNCELNLLLGEPIWSPSGERMIILQPKITAVSRRTFFILNRIDSTTFAQTVQTTGNELLDAFWVTEQIVGLIEQSTGSQRITLSNVETGQEVPLLTTADFNQLITDESAQFQPTIEQVAVGGENQEFLAINLNKRYFVLHNRERNISTNLGAFGNDLFLPPNGRSPNGRYLTFLTASSLNIIDLLSFEKQLIPLDNYARVGSLIDWDSSGDWLLMTTETNIIMHHLPSNQTDYFSHDQSFCLGSAWVEAD